MRKRGNKQITDSITTIYCDVKSSQLAKLWRDAHVRATCIIKRTDRKTPDKGSQWNKYIREQQRQQRKTTRKEREKKKKITIITQERRIYIDQTRKKKISLFLCPWAIKRNNTKSDDGGSISFSILCRPDNNQNNNINFKNSPVRQQ